ncbi:MAG: hypothetical protein ACYTBJ_06060 [Planctomycetota bacterium]|jgi:Ca2+/H+ antiporter
MEKTAAAVAEMEAADEAASRQEAAEAARKVLAALAEEKEPMRSLTLSTVYYCAAGVFTGLYLLFLWRITVTHSRGC